MVCYNPILMYPVEGAITKNGKQHYSFYGSLASHPELASDSRFIRCSCKQCIGCRLENSRQWAVRAVHEARSSSSAYFVTCTFDTISGVTFSLEGGDLRATSDERGATSAMAITAPTGSSCDRS